MESKLNRYEPGTDKQWVTCLTMSYRIMCTTHHGFGRANYSWLLSVVGELCRAVLVCIRMLALPDTMSNNYVWTGGQ